MLKKYFVAFSLLVILLLSATIVAAEPVKLTMWTWFDTYRDVFPKIVDQWNATHPDIQVEQQIFSLDEYLQNLQAAVAAGREPDIFGPHTNVRGFGEAGITVDFNKYFDQDFLSQFTDSTINQFTWDGHLYALPWSAQMLGIFYNKDIFNKLGLKIPETWDEMIAVAKQIREKSKMIQPVAFGDRGKWAGCDFFLPLITQVTDDPKLVLNIDRKTGAARDVSWNSKPVIDALRLLKKLVDNNVFEPGANGLSNDQALNMFYMGRAAMYISGSWMPMTFKMNAPDSLNWDVFKMPAYGPDKRHWSGDESGSNLAVSARSKHSKEAIEFLKYLYSPDVYQMALNEAVDMPAVKDVDIKDPIMKKMASWLPDGAPHILYGAGSWDAVANAVRGIFAGQLTPEQAAAQMEKAVQQARNK